MKKKISCMLVFLISIMPVISMGAASNCIEGNCVAGTGVMQYEGGEKYSGEFKDSKRHGYGTLTSATGKRYEGEWVNDLQNGQGTLISPNGAKYTGAFKHNRSAGPITAKA